MNQRISQYFISNNKKSYSKLCYNILEMEQNNFHFLSPQNENNNNMLMLNFLWDLVKYYVKFNLDIALVFLPWTEHDLIPYSIFSFKIGKLVIYGTLSLWDEEICRKWFCTLFHHAECWTNISLFLPLSVLFLQWYS